MSEAVSLLEVIKRGGYEASLITTFNATLPFYEEVLLRKLVGAGCRHNVVLMDRQQCAVAWGADTGQGELGDVIEGGASSSRQNQVHVHTAGLHGLVLVTHLVAGRLKHTLQTTQYGERQDDTTEFRLSEVATQHVGHAPNEVG